LLPAPIREWTFILLFRSFYFFLKSFFCNTFSENLFKKRLLFYGKYFFKYSSSHPLFQKTFFVIQNPSTKNIFCKIFHTPHNPFLILFFGIHFQNTKLQKPYTHLQLLCNAKIEVTYLTEKLSLQHLPPCSPKKVSF